MKSLHQLSLMLLVCFGLSGCSGPNPYGTTYAASEAQGISEVYYGTIVNLTPVTINNSDGNNFIGSLAGAAIGGILGSDVGGGTGSEIAAIGGGVVGSYLGSEAANKIGEKNGVNITIRLKNKEQTISIVQPVDPKQLFKVGQEVQISVQNDSARVTQFKMIKLKMSGL